MSSSSMRQYPAPADGRMWIAKWAAPGFTLVCGTFCIWGLSEEEHPQTGPIYAGHAGHPRFRLYSRRHELVNRLAEGGLVPVELGGRDQARVGGVDKRRRVVLLNLHSPRRSPAPNDGMHVVDAHSLAHNFNIERRE